MRVFATQSTMIESISEIFFRAKAAMARSGRAFEMDDAEDPIAQGMVCAEGIHLGTAMAGAKTPRRQQRCGWWARLERWRRSRRTFLNPLSFVSIHSPELSSWRYVLWDVEMLKQRCARAYSPVATQLLTSLSKLFLKRPAECQPILGSLLKLV